MQELVQQFHKKYGHAIGSAQQPGVTSNATIRLRRDLIAEEAKELDSALFKLYMLQGANEPFTEELYEVIDGMADLVYVVLGTAVSLGIDLEAHVREVHRSNMTKANVRVQDGEKYAVGGGKGPDYVPPDHAGVLNHGDFKLVRDSWSNNNLSKRCAICTRTLGIWPSTSNPVTIHYRAGEELLHQYVHCCCPEHAQDVLRIAERAVEYSES